MLNHMALLYPERLEAMVVMAGGHRLPIAVRVERRERAGRWEERMPEAWARLVQRHGGPDRARWVAAQMDRFGDEFSDFLTPEHLATIETPTLLVWGDRDANFDVEFALEMYRAIPNAALWVVPGSAHSAVWESEEAGAMFPTIVHKFFQAELTG